MRPHYPETARKATSQTVGAESCDTSELSSSAGRSLQYRHADPRYIRLAAVGVLILVGYWICRGIGYFLGY